MKTILFLLFALSLQATLYAQSTARKFYDFNDIDARTIDREALARQVDSAYVASRLDSLAQLYQYATERFYTPRYSAFMIGYQSGFADLGDLEAGLATLGVAGISEHTRGVLWGVDIKGKRLLFSFHMTAPVPSKKTLGEYRVKVGAFDVDMLFGYDLINAKRIQLYPQVGVAFQRLEVDILNTAVPANVTDVPSAFGQLYETDMAKRSFVVMGGIELDYHLSYSDGKGGIILGLRGGVTSESSGRYRIEGEKTAFRTSDRARPVFAAVVVKFYIRSHD